MATGDDIVKASLPSINLLRLQARDENEVNALLRACSGHGFFYLDLQGAQDIIQTWRKLLDVSSTYFAQPFEHKMQDSRESDTQGYEPTGTSVGAHDHDVDAYESLKVSRREMLNNHAELTTSVGEHSDVIFKFISNAHEITMMILEQLSNALDLPESQRFESFHRSNQPSLSTLAFFHYPKHDSHQSGFGHNKHTDIGTLTFLLCEQYGLQVLSPGNESWAFVEPRPNHAVINVGDSLRFVSGHRLSSAVHRVIPLREKQMEDRYSIAYFLRMENEARYRDGANKTWSAQEWHNSKFDIFRDPRLPNGSEMLTGGMESDGKLRTQVAT